jgi:hypothetical protein
MTMAGFNFDVKLNTLAFEFTYSIQAFEVQMCQSALWQPLSMQCAELEV